MTAPVARSKTQEKNRQMANPNQGYAPVNNCVLRSIDAVPLITSNTFQPRSVCDLYPRKTVVTVQSPTTVAVNSPSNNSESNNPKARITSPAALINMPKASA